jgi:deoxyribodipyrimidine photo-lyase
VYAQSATLCALKHNSLMSRLVWHRRDLRLSDNELYHNATKIYSVFIFDPSDYAPRPTVILSDGNNNNNGGQQLQSVNHGPHYSSRLISAVHSLRENLQSLGGDLIIRTGNPVDIISKLVQELRIEEVAWSEIPGYYECEQSNALKQVLQLDVQHRCRVFTTCSLTLVHPNDLPTDVHVWRRLARPNEKRKQRRKRNAGKSELQSASHGNISSSTNPSKMVNVTPSRFEGMPVIMGDFRRAARTTAKPRELFLYPDSDCLAAEFENIDLGEVPSLDELTRPLLESSEPVLGCIPNDLIKKLVESANAMPRCEDMEEQSALRHVKDFVKNHAANADRSLCDVSDHNSSKLSQPLALGTLSPRQVYHCVREEQSRLEQIGHNTATDINWLISHMEMRDYFLFNHFRQGRSAYNLHPITPVHKPDTPRKWLPLSENREQFIRWASGHTGLPMVDAGMKELISTGYTSNRVRQNMASVLTKDLHLDWRLGAEWYQLCLEDHCVAGKPIIFSSSISLVLKNK